MERIVHPATILPLMWYPVTIGREMMNLISSGGVTSVSIGGWRCVVVCWLWLCGGNGKIQLGIEKQYMNDEMCVGDVRVCDYGNNSPRNNWTLFIVVDGGVELWWSIGVANLDLSCPVLSLLLLQLPPLLLYYYCCCVAVNLQLLPAYMVVYVVGA